MAFWKRRKRDEPRPQRPVIPWHEAPAPVPVEEKSQFPFAGALTPLMDDLAGDNMPAELTPKDDFAKEKVFDDEVDPSWRDPGTAE